jgi:anti-sigma regulatory factor (Ser/Thr protein kinase)
MFFDEWLAAEPDALRSLRRRVRTTLRTQGLGPNDIDTVLLVVDELVTNAIEHGTAYRQRAKPLHARLQTDGDDLVLEFEDRDMPPPQIALLAKALADGDIELPDLEDERGRGLFLVLTSMQSIVVEDRTAQAEGMRLQGRFVGIARA